MRGVGAELQGGLIGGQSEVGEQVANLLLAGIDDLTGRRLIDGGSDLLTQELETAAQLLQQGVRRQGGFGRHRLLLFGEENRQRAQLHSR